MKTGIGRPLRAAASILLLLAASGVGHAQIWRGGCGSTPPRFPVSKTFRGDFNFCRVIFASNRREKRGWDTDYPGADINVSVRLSELTKTLVPIRHNDSS